VEYYEYDTRVAAYAVVVDEQDRILLTWFNGSTPGWSLPGGGVEYDESLEEAVVREVREESGYDVEVGRPLTTHSFVGAHSRHTGNPYKSVRVLFDATIVGGTLGTLEVGGTTDFAEWVPLADLEDPAAPPCADIVALAVSAHRSRSAAGPPGR
jgi:8-oxo-dGTP diphosphatase